MEEQNPVQHEQVAKAEIYAIGSEAERMRGWLLFIGWFTLIGGALQALSIVGILVAWIPILMGVWLIQAAGRIADYKATGDNLSLAQMMAKLRSYFTLSGVMMIISLAGMVLAMAIWGTVIIAALTGAINSSF